MIALLSPALVGTVRYEFRMATRTRVLWLAAVPLLALAALFSLVSPHPADSSSSQLIASWALMVNLIATLGPGVALADRFARDRALGLTDLLAATPANTTVRMAGTLVGSLAAALAPAAVLLLGVGVAVAGVRRDPAALGWALVALVGVVLPAALQLVTFAAAAGSLLPVPFARVATVFVWLWATVLNTRLIPVPTITGTLLSPLGDYVTFGWLHGDRLWAGRGWSVLSPSPTALTALLNIAAVLAVAGVFFTAARLIAAQRR